MTRRRSPPSRSCYLAPVIGLGYLGYRQTRVHDDYMVAGRRIHPLVLALSYGATFISTSAIVGFGGAGPVAAPLRAGDRPPHALARWSTRW